MLQSRSEKFLKWACCFKLDIEITDGHQVITCKMENLIVKLNFY